jgi:hypothetical protein
MEFNHPAPHFPVQGLSFRNKKSLATASSPISACCDRTVSSSTSLVFLAPRSKVSAAPVPGGRSPPMDHYPMHAIFGGQLRHRALALNALQRHASLEARIMVPALRIS